MDAAATFVADDPLRPPDWRFRLAERHVERGLMLSHGSLDAATVRYGRYLFELKKPRIDKPRLAITFGDIHAAAEIHAAANNLRWVVEARVLAAQSADEIAALLGVPPLAVESFEAIFFDVRNRLAQSDFILRHVIDSSIAADQFENYGWKFIAFLGGAGLLDQVLGRPGQGDFSGQQRLATRLMLELKKFIAARTLDPIAAIKIPALAKSATPEDVPASDDGYAENMQALLESMAFLSVGRSNEASLPWYYHLPFELRGDQLILAACDLPIEGLDDYADFKYPEKT